MTPEEISSLKAGDRLQGPLYHRAEVVRLTPNAILVLWEDGEENLYDPEDPVLASLSYMGPREISEPWLRGTRH
jgi:hypothetical protein